MKRVVVFSKMDGARAREVRLIQEAAKRGEVHLIIPSDGAVRELWGQSPHFPFEERLYLAQALRFVTKVYPCQWPNVREGFEGCTGFKPDFWVRGPEASMVAQGERKPEGVEVVWLSADDLAGFPEQEPLPATGRPKVVVTGCYDWLHSGHVAFFEEASAYGDLYVCLGNDANIEALKGKGHPLFKAGERQFLVSSIRYVTQALISKGMGQLDAEEEILNVIHPAIYAVNEDGHRPEKAEFCARHGIRYLVLKRTPKEGLAVRSSTDLRGF